MSRVGTDLYWLLANTILADVISLHSRYLAFSRLRKTLNVQGPNNADEKEVYRVETCMLMLFYLAEIFVS